MDEESGNKTPSPIEPWRLFMARAAQWIEGMERVKGINFYRGLLILIFTMIGGTYCVRKHKHDVFVAKQIVLCKIQLGSGTSPPNYVLALGRHCRTGN